MIIDQQFLQYAIAEKRHQLATAQDSEQCRLLLLEISGLERTVE